MELRHLRYFVAVAEELHFGRAAQRLQMSQPPLSQQIKDLETEVGARLLTRNKHKVTLTSVGEATLVEAYRVLENADHLRAVARQANAGVVKRLNIGCVSSVMFDILPPILKRLHAEHPEIGLSLQDQETIAAVPALLEEKLDVAFIRIDKIPKPLEARLVIRDYFIVAVPNRHPLARRKSVPFASLINEPLIIYTRRMDPRTHDRIIAGCLKAGFKPNIVYQSPSIQSQIGMVASELGIAIVPNAVRHWRIPGVIYRPLENPIEAASVSIVWNKLRRSEAVDLLLEATQRAFP